MEDKGIVIARAIRKLDEANFTYDVHFAMNAIASDMNDPRGDVQKALRALDKRAANGKSLDRDDPV